MEGCKKEYSKLKGAPKVTIDNSLPDLSNHPVVLKKAEAARKFLEEHPVPEHLLKG